MSLERKDVRAYLDADVHEAITRYCNRRGTTVADFIETTVKDRILRLGHDAIETADDFRDLGIFRKNPELPGIPSARGRK